MFALRVSLMSCKFCSSLLVSLLVSLFMVSLASAAPISYPNISNCRLNRTTIVNCCAPPPLAEPKPFQFPNISTVKVRRPAQLISHAEAQKLAKAYQAMRQLPEDDPRHFDHQANIHCAYCEEYYFQGSSTTAPLQIHASWLFFSFHRWYVYFHERILAKLLGDDTLAIPFWNYDNPEASSMPSVYLNYAGLNDVLREPSRMPPAVIEMDKISLNFDSRTREDQINVNRHAFYFIMVSGATTPLRFFGQPYRLGDKQRPGFGTAETMPHDSVHSWVGDRNSGYRDMGLFETSGRDPLFYAHHASIDRLWEVWKTLSENNTDIDDPDYLDSEFVFYDENAELVKVTVRDSLNVSLLGYTYEEIENDWLTATPAAQSVGVAELSEDAVICQMGEALEEPCSASVARDTITLSTLDEKAETLVIEGVQVNASTKPVHFNVFVNLPTADASTMINCTEFAGAFSTLPSKELISSSLRLGIGFITRQLNLTSEDSLVVTIVPTTGVVASMTSIAIECEDVAGLSYSLLREELSGHVQQ